MGPNFPSRHQFPWDTVQHTIRLGYGFLVVRFRPEAVSTSMKEMHLLVAWADGKERLPVFNRLAIAYQSLYDLACHV